MILLAMGLACFALALNITIVVLQRRMIAELEEQLSETFTLVDNTLEILKARQELDDNDFAQWAEHNGYAERTQPAAPALQDNHGTKIRGGGG